MGWSGGFDIFIEVMSIECFLFGFVDENLLNSVHNICQVSQGDIFSLQDGAFSLAKRILFLEMQCSF